MAKQSKRKKKTRSCTEDQRYLTYRVVHAIAGECRQLARCIRSTFPVVAVHKPVIYTEGYPST